MARNNAIQVKDFKKIIGDKLVKRNGGRKIRIPIFSNLKEKFRSRQLKKLDSEIERLNKSVEYFYNLAKDSKRKDAREAALVEATKKKYELDKLIAKRNKISKATDFEVIEDKLQNIFPKMSKPDISRIADYYNENTGVFEIGNEKFDINNLNEEKKKEVYASMIRAFNDMEDTEDIRLARKLENFGKLTYGDKFIRDFAKLELEDKKNVKRELCNSAVPGILAKLEKNAQEILAMDKEEQAEELKGISIADASLDEKHLQELREKYKQPKALPAATLETEQTPAPAVEPEQTLEPELEQTPEPTLEPAQEKPEMEAEKIAEYNANKDKYTIAIENAQDRIAEIDAKIKDYHDKHNSILENKGSAFAAGFNVAMGDIIADNYDSYKDSIRDLEIEREKLMQDIKQNEETRRQEKIEADKVAREERLNEINKKAKEQWEANQKDLKLAEAKAVLPHLETSTGFYDISNLTDEEILNVYNSIESSPSMEDRLAKAKEASANDKPEQTPAPTLEPEQTLEPIMLPDEQEPVKPVEPELPSLTAEDSEQLANKATETRQKITELMNIVPGMTEEQARNAVQSDDAYVQELINNLMEKQMSTPEETAGPDFSEQKTTEQKAQELIFSNIYGNEVDEEFTEEEVNKAMEAEVDEYIKNHPDVSRERAIDAIRAINSLGTETIEAPTVGRSR